MKTAHFVGLYVWNDMNPTISIEGIKELIITVTNHPTFHGLLLSEKDYKELHDTISIVNQERTKLGHSKIIVSSRY